MCWMIQIAFKKQITREERRGRRYDRGEVVKEEEQGNDTTINVKKRSGEQRGSELEDNEEKS